MCKGNVKFQILKQYITEAFKLEWNSNSGKWNMIFTAGLFLLVFANYLTSGIENVINLLFHIFYLKQPYHSPTDYRPLVVTVGWGSLCLLLMVFVVDKRETVKRKKVSKSSTNKNV